MPDDQDIADGHRSPVITQSSSIHKAPPVKLEEEVIDLTLDDESVDRKPTAEELRAARLASASPKLHIMR